MKHPRGRDDKQSMYAPSEQIHPALPLELQLLH